jgi:hypothetical protein
MKKICFSWLALFLMGINFSEGALPPLYQSIHEFSMLLENPELSKKLESGELIISIKRIDNGLEITTNKHSLYAEIVNDPMKMPGPQKFHFVIHDPKPL